MAIRFWDHINGGLVKLTLKEGEYAEWSKSEPTDEGYRFVHCLWSYKHGFIKRHYTSGGRDCDGLIRRHFDHVAFPDKLKEVVSNSDPSVMLPQWELENEGVYDQFAQLAGY